MTYLDSFFSSVSGVLSAVSSRASLVASAVKAGQASVLSGVTKIADAGGLFAFDASDSTTPDDGGTVLAATGGRWKRVHDGTQWSVRWFGAVDDGVTDSGPSIQKAIDACSTAGGGEVWFPKTGAGGVYLTSVTLTVPSNVRLVGPMKGVTVREHSTLGIAPIIKIGNVLGAQVVDVAIVNLTIRNGSASTSAPTSGPAGGQDGIRIENADNVLIDNCKITEIRGYYGCSAVKTTNLRVDRCTFYRVTYAALMILTECDGVDVGRSTFDTTTSTAAANGYLFATGSESAGAFAVRNVRVHDNTFRNNLASAGGRGWDCINSHGGENIWIEDNTCSDSYYGISLSLVSSVVTGGAAVLKNVHIRGNKVTSGQHQAPNASAPGILVSGELASSNTPKLAEGVYIEGNSLDGFGCYAASLPTYLGAITVALAKDVRITGKNRCDNYNGCAVMLQRSVHDCVIDELTILDKQTVGTGVTDAWGIIHLQDGIWGLRLGRIDVFPRTEAAAPKHVWKPRSNFHSSQVDPRAWNIKHAVTGLVDTSDATVPIEQASKPTDKLVLSYGDSVHTSSGGHPQWRQSSHPLGYASLDVATNLLSVTITATSKVGTITNVTDPVWERVPVGANVILIGAGVAGGNLNARVVANDGQTLTFDTAAITTCNGGSPAILTWQGLTLGNLTSFGADDIVTTGSLKIGSGTLASVGALRVAKNVIAVAMRNSGNSGDHVLASDGSDTVYLDQTTGTFQVRIAGSAKLQVNASAVILSASTLEWDASQAPLITQLTKTSDAACADINVKAQAPYASATGSNRVGGNVIFDTPANAGGYTGAYPFIALRSQGSSGLVVGTQAGDANAYVQLNASKIGAYTNTPVVRSTVSGVLSGSPTLAQLTAVVQAMAAALGSKTGGIGLFNDTTT